MSYFILILLFIAVFFFLFWRILTRPRNPGRTEESDKYTCPVCDEKNCDCHRHDGHA